MELLLELTVYDIKFEISAPIEIEIFDYIEVWYNKKRFGA